MKNVKKYPVFIVVIVLLIAIGTSLSVYSGRKNEKPAELLPLSDKISVVCIDPGHGGHDPGCHGASVNEKNIALAISLKLGNLIEKNFPNVKVVYTRKTDVFVELHKRAEIANKAKADLFICIHCNAGGPDAHGSETYALGLHKTEANLNVAKRENGVVMMEGDYQENYKGFDVNSPEGSIIMELYQKAYLNRSLSFASKVQKYFKEDAGRYDRGVKQAGFLVLWKSAMPAVLIETGFLTNVKEEKYLMDPANQEVMARSIYKAFVDYKNELEGTKFSYNLDGSSAKNESKNDTQTEQKSEVKDNAKVVESKDSENKKSTETKADEITFRVQFMSLPEKISLNDSRIKNLEAVKIYPNGKYFGYTSGVFKNMDEAKKHMQKVHTQGYKDAFVVIFKGETRISQKEYESIKSK